MQSKITGSILSGIGIVTLAGLSLFGSKNVNLENRTVDTLKSFNANDSFKVACDRRHQNCDAIAGVRG